MPLEGIKTEAGPEQEHQKMPTMHTPTEAKAPQSGIQSVPCQPWECDCRKIKPTVPSSVGNKNHISGEYGLTYRCSMLQVAIMAAEEKG